MKSIVIAALLGAICIDTTQSIHIEQFESIKEEPSAADEYDASVKEEKDALAKEAKKEAVKEAKKEEEKKEAEKRKELIIAERSVRDEEEADRKQKSIEEQKAKELNDAMTGDKFAGADSREFNEMNRKWYNRDQKYTKERLDAPLIAKGIRTPHRLDNVAPEDRSTSEEIEFQAREATLEANGKAHKAKVAKKEELWASSGEDFAKGMC